MASDTMQFSRGASVTRPTPDGHNRITIADIRRHNADAGQYFFSRATLRFFGSRVLPTIYSGPGGVFFVTSEQPPDGQRVYKVREYNIENGHVWSADELWWPTARLAKWSAGDKARKLASTALK